MKADKLLNTRIFLFIALLVTSYFIAELSLASTPDTIVYEGRLLDSSGNPETTAHVFRFSLWTSADFIAGDIDGAGAINTGAANYGGWFESQTITPNSNGTVSVNLGDAVALPTIDFTNHKYLQVEVKVSGDPNTSYQLLDPTGDDGADTNDRQTIGSVPYSKTAQRAVSSSGTTFVVSPDSNNATLQFGQVLTNFIQFDSIAGTFDFSNKRLINIADPTSAQDAATKNYVDLKGNYVGATTGTYDGNITSNGEVSYKAVNDVCNTDFTGSHICSTDEILGTIATIDTSSFTGNMWIAEGPPGYTASANDCDAWTTDGASDLAPFWNWDANAGGGKGFLTPCTSTLKIACCR